MVGPRKTNRWPVVFWAAALCLLAVSAPAQKFYPDDPLVKEPPPLPVQHANFRALSELMEFAANSFSKPGERHPLPHVIPAGGVNTLGEVMDGAWYVNRHARLRLTPEELRRGPGDSQPPAMDVPWMVLVVKKEGLRPGILIADKNQNLYLLRFDPPGAVELATGADMVTSRFFHALGYHVPEDYIVYFERSQLVAADSGEQITSLGKSRDLQEEDINNFLLKAAWDPQRGYRAVASRLPRGWGKLLGPFQVFGERSDDPNDIVPHEHRRDLRGLAVFCAWLNHNNMRAMNTLDVLIEEENVESIRHFLIDFAGSLGSGIREPKPAWQGNEPITGEKIFRNIGGFGLITDPWMRAKHPKIAAVGRFEAETFDPEEWTTNHPLAPFLNRLPDDTFWAAAKVMAFTDDDIRTLVETGQYTDPAAVTWIARCLMERRDRIGRIYFDRVLPLDGFRVEATELKFDDLAVRHGFAVARTYRIQWSQFDNRQGTHQPIGAGPTESLALPEALRQSPAGSYFCARIDSGNPALAVLAYLRREADGWTVVGIEREWPGKSLATSQIQTTAGKAQKRYADLTDRQRALFSGYAAAYSERSGTTHTPENFFNSLPISEQTTFDAVTHALIHSPLTDASGQSLGVAIDLVQGIERIAGQYYGRSGDQQFRLYCFMKPAAQETLVKCREFSRDEENTIYHTGYPHSYRQAGKPPSIQISMSADGAKADIDVDYRSSKLPSALFNGHLTSANSDVRAGDNFKAHSGRWAGFVAWWQEVFRKMGKVEGESEAATLPKFLPEAPTPMSPDRPAGAVIDDLPEAVAEFLADWLVRRQYGEVREFLSPRLLACVNIDDDVQNETIRADEAKAKLREVMIAAVERLGRRDNLTEAVDAVMPTNPDRKVVEQPYDGDFTVIELTNAEARQYLCDPGEYDASLPPDGRGVYYGVIFKFKLEGSGVLGLLWTRVDGRWQIVAYRVFAQ